MMIFTCTVHHNTGVFFFFFFTELKGGNDLGSMFISFIFGRGP